MALSSGARIFVHHKPAGIAVLVTPWNFPAAMAIRKIGSALAAGCPVILKPSSETLFIGIPRCGYVQLQSTHSCPSYLLARGKGKNISPGKSCASAIAHEILQTMGKLNGSVQKKATDCSLLCECGEQLERAEGCLVCRSCGYAKC